MSTEDERPALEIVLRDGAIHQGWLVLERAELLALEVEGRILEVLPREVVARRYLEQDPAWARAQGGPRGPFRVERSGGGARSVAALAESLGRGACALYLPARLPDELRAGLGAEAPGRQGPHPLWGPSAELPLELVPHLLALEGEDLTGERERRIAALGPSDLALCASPSPPALVARYLGGLRRAYQAGGRRCGLRFYDPLVLSDLWEVLEPGNAGVLVGTAWTRAPQGADESLCPLCDRPWGGLALSCSGCPGQLGGELAAPVLITAWGVRDPAAPEDLVRAEPWPPTPRPGARGPLRPRQRGAKALVLSPDEVRALGLAFARRRAGS